MNIIHNAVGYIDVGTQPLSRLKMPDFISNVLSKLTDQQKKIALVASVVMGALTAIFIAYQCCFRSRSIPFSSTNIHRGGGGGFQRGGGGFQNNNNYIRPNYNYNNNDYNNYNQYVDPNNIPPPSSEELDLSDLEQKIQTLKEKIELEEQILQTLLSTDTPKADTKEVKEDLADIESKEESSKTTDNDQVQTDAATTEVKATTDETEKAEAESKATVAVDEDIDPAAAREVQIAGKQLEIDDLKADLDTALKSYGQTFRLYLENQFKDYRKNNHEIHAHIATLIGFMDSYSDKNEFIEKNLEHIDLFLANTFFTSGHCLDEGKKVDLAVFNHFYTIVDTHFLAINDTKPELAQKLKVKLANLPLIDEIDRTKFSKAYLSEKDQVELLTSHFEKKEEECVQEVIKQFKNYQTQSLTDQEVKKLAKLASEDRTHLANANKFTLQDALQDLLGNKAPANWKDHQKVYDTLKQFFKPATNSYGYNNGYNSQISEIETLQRASKARQFFDDQLGLEESEIQIPRWYHASNYVADIIKKGDIEVRHQQAFRGAWVSAQREISFGSYTLSFNHRIAKLDKDVFIGYEQGQIRWRGLQAAIPIIESSQNGKIPIPYIACVGVPKATQKANKAAIVNLLKQKGIPHTKVFHNEQIDFMQQEIVKIMGAPHLSENWWGKGDMQRVAAPQN